MQNIKCTYTNKISSDLETTKERGRRYFRLMLLFAQKDNKKKQNSVHRIRGPRKSIRQWEKCSKYWKK